MAGLTGTSNDAHTFTVNFAGDVMLGRLIDQLLPEHVDCDEEQQLISQYKASPDPVYAHLRDYSFESPWGDALSLFRAADLNLINLETSVTTQAEKWPNKTFNYRMHPTNIACLTTADIDYVTLSNNHTLDFSEVGLSETISTVRDANIAFAGVGSDIFEVRNPAVLTLPRSPDATSTPTPKANSQRQHYIHVWAASDHPSEWRSVPAFHFLSYTPACKSHLRETIQWPRATKPSLKIFSVHWGPNYSWRPAKEIIDMAHFLVDSCRVDIVHGHSSHHVQGVEVRRVRRDGVERHALIIYGCGDFVDDYGVVREFRNDLGGLWQVRVREGEGGGLVLDNLEVRPSRVRSFRVEMLEEDEVDFSFVRDKVVELSAEFGTTVKAEGDRLVVDLSM